MTNYYKDKMDNAHKQWQIAFDSGKDKAAKKHMEDFINYQKMYNDRMKEVGEE